MSVASTLVAFFVVAAVAMPGGADIKQSSMGLSNDNFVERIHKTTIPPPPSPPGTSQCRCVQSSELNEYAGSGLCGNECCLPDDSPDECYYWKCQEPGGRACRLPGRPEYTIYDTRDACQNECKDAK